MVWCRCGKRAPSRSISQFPGQVLVSLGGGSSMDAGKAMAMLGGQPEGSRIMDYTMVPQLVPGTVIN